MKKYNLILAILLVISCSKVEYEKNDVRDNCEPLANLESYLIGKWKLETRLCNHTNSINCATVGGNWYDVSIFPANYIIEINGNGKIKMFKDNTLMQSFIATGWSFNGVNSGDLSVNCGKSQFLFQTINSLDTLSNVVVGSTLKISNQFIDLNFENYPVVSKCVRQHYIKIE